MTTLYHYTCDHGRRGIGDRGELRPWAYGVVWLTDMDWPMPEPLGLTSYALSCNRMAHRYRVTDDADCIQWVRYEHRERWIEIEGTRPMHWWVSERRVPVVYDPLRSLDDLLPPDEQRALNDDLGEMARKRRRAEARTGSVVLP